MPNPIQRLGLWLAGKSRATGETLERNRLNRPYRPTYELTNRDALREGYVASGLVYACVRLISNTAASVPLLTYTRNGDDWEPAPDHPMQALLDTPNARLTRRRMLTRAVQHLMLTGNAIWTKVRVPKSGPPTALWPINPDQIRPVPDAKDLVSHYELRVDGTPYRIEARDVVHMLLDSPESPWWGIGPLQAAMLDVQLYRGNKGWNLRTVERGAVTPGVLEVPENLSIEQFQTIRKQLDQRAFGHEDAGRELILGSGMKYTRMALTGEELGFLESMRFGREEISMIFGVPAPLLTPENATLANVEAYDRQYWQNTIVPLNAGLADVLTQSLVPDFGARVEDLIIAFDYSQVPAMQDSLTDQSEVAERLIRAGFTPEGVNRLLDLGFADDEVKVTPDPSAFAFAQPRDPEGEPREDRARARPRGRKDALADAWKARDDERAAWEVEVAKRITRLFQAERDAVVRAYRAAPSVETANAAVTQNEPAWRATLEAALVAASEHFARLQYDTLAPKAHKAFDPTLLAIEWASTHAARHVTAIADTTRDMLRDIITEGLTPDADGFQRTIDQIARDIADTYDTWMFTGDTPDLTIMERSYMIARTELGAATNVGHQQGAEQAAQEYGLDLEKVWASSLDERVRATHAIHGETAPMDGLFSNGLRYPGDPDGAAEEVINCRCTVVHRVRRPS